MTDNKEKTLEDKMLDKMTDSERITYLHNKLERSLDMVLTKLCSLGAEIHKNIMVTENNSKLITEIIKNLNPLLPTPDKREAEHFEKLVKWNTDFRLKGLETRLKKIENIIKEVINNDKK